MIKNWFGQTKVDRYFNGVLFVFMAATFFFQRLQPPMIVLLFFGFFLEVGSKQEAAARLTWKKPLFWLLVFFAMHVAGVLYSTDTSAGWLDVSMKLSLLIFPVYFAFSKRHDFRLLMNYFAIIGTLSALICIIAVVIKVVFYNHNPLKSESEFSLFMHRSYQAIYWVIGFLWCIFQVLESKKYRLTYLLLGGILALGCFLTFSKAGILALLISCVVLFFLLIFKYKMYRVALFSFLSGIVLLFVINFITPKPLARFQAMTSQLFSSDAPESNSSDSNNARILMWETSLEVIAENPILGVGTGDVTKALNDRNSEKHLDAYVEANMNSHNQFLNSGAALGIVGILLMLVIMVTSLLSIKIQGGFKWVVLLIICSIYIFLLTESGLERQAGVVIFSFFICLFATNSLKQNAQLPGNLEE